MMSFFLSDKSYCMSRGRGEDIKGGMTPPAHFLLTEQRDWSNLRPACQTDKNNPPEPNERSRKCVCGRERESASCVSFSSFFAIKT